MKIRSFVFILLGMVLLASCYYDVEEELYPGCDTSNATFSGDVQKILASQCLTCHNSRSQIGGGINLEGYNAVKVYVDNGKLLSSIKHEATAKPMPKNAPQLPRCSIQAIETWINEGAPNN